MGWKIEFLKEAEKEFGKLPRNIQLQITNYLNKLLLRNNPREAGKALRGDKSGLWRYRVEKYRIICKIEDKRLIILIVKVGKRDRRYD